MKELPKIDLHLHIDGAVRTATMLDLAREQNFPLPASDVAGLEKHVQVSPDCRSLTEFLATFEVFYDLLKAPDALERVTRELCEDLIADGVIYAELRFAPVLNVRNMDNARAEMREMVRAAIRGLQTGVGTELKAGLLLCCYRGFDVEYALETVEIARELRDELGTDAHIAGLDLAGDESRYAAASFKEPFDLARDYGLPVTVHAAEGAGPESARDALDILHARRIGHGIRIREDQALSQRVLDEQIPLEVCLTSNLQTQTVASLQEHPFLDYLQQGMAVTLNTDDPSISGITLSDEWQMAVKDFKLAPDSQQKILHNSLNAAFVEDSVRSELRRKVEGFFSS